MLGFDVIVVVVVWATLPSTIARPDKQGRCGTVLPPRGFQWGNWLLLHWSGNRGTSSKAGRVCLEGFAEVHCLTQLGLRNYEQSLHRLIYTYIYINVDMDIDIDVGARRTPVISVGRCFWARRTAVWVRLLRCRDLIALRKTNIGPEGRPLREDSNP